MNVKRDFLVSKFAFTFNACNRYIEELGALRKEVEALPEGERAAALQRIKSVETIFAKRSL